MTASSTVESLRADVFARAEEEHIKFVSLQFTDIMGVPKNVTVPLHKLADAIEHGVWFDGSSIDGFARVHESDMYLQPDLATFRTIPWEESKSTTARVICGVFTPDGSEFSGDPRFVLRRSLAAAAEIGYAFLTGPEMEFFLLKPDENGNVGSPPHDHASYFDVTTDKADEVRKEIVSTLEAMGIMVDASHHEVATGQHEIDLVYADALATADNTVACRMTVKAVAQQHGLYATFMPKPFFGINGSGMHTHQSLADALTGRNVFHGPEDEYGLSTIARQFIAGQLAHARGMSAILAPLVNSYKRLVPGYEAPAYVSWARINRSALVRVPHVIAGRPEATRIELRCPDPSCNPYLALGVMIATGLDGIRRELVPPQPIEEDLFHFDERMMEKYAVATLPLSLGEALDELERDEVVMSALGDHVSEWFLAAKRGEWADYRVQVTQWEKDHYLEVY